MPDIAIPARHGLQGAAQVTEPQSVRASTSTNAYAYVEALSNTTCIDIIHDRILCIELESEKIIESDWIVDSELWKYFDIFFRDWERQFQW